MHTLFVQKPHSLLFVIHVISMVGATHLESIANEILNCFNDFCIISNQLFLLPNFPQKRAKKLEGETLYIRHSNLMLEVCIFRYLFWLLAVTFLCLHASCVDVRFCFNTTVSLFWIACLNFSLALKAWHALFSSLILMQVASLHFHTVSINSYLKKMYMKYMIGEGFFL